MTNGIIYHQGHKIRVMGKDLIASYEGISDINDLEGFEVEILIESIDLSNNKITKFQGLDFLSRLRNLDLSHNQIEEIRGFDNLEKLKIISLFRNKIPKKLYKQLESLGTQGFVEFCK